MAKFITRTISFTRISCVQLVVDETGEGHMVPGKDIVVFERNITRERANQLIRKEYGPEFTATRIIEDGGVWKMSLQDFVIYGHKAEADDGTPGEDEDDDMDEGSSAAPAPTSDISGGAPAGPDGADDSSEEIPVQGADDALFGDDMVPPPAEDDYPEYPDGDDGDYGGF